MRFIRDIIAEKRVDHPDGEAVPTPETSTPELTFDMDQFDLLSEDATPKSPLPSETVPTEQPCDETDGIDLSALTFDAATTEVDGDAEAEPDPLDRLLADATDPAPAVNPEPTHAFQDASQSRPAQTSPITEPMQHTTPQASDTAMPETSFQAAPPMPREPEPIGKPPSPTVEVPRPAAGRSAGRTGRVKTRLLGFGEPQDAKLDPFDKSDKAATSTHSTYPVGWLIVVDGPGRGAAFTIHDGVASIGRDAGQVVALAFGDNSISRENHAAIAYDDEQRGFFLGHGGKANLVRLNGRPVLSTEELSSDDTIRIGETTLRFIALCGADFSWSQPSTAGGGHASAI